MPKNSTEYGMNRTDWTIAKQQAYMREAVAVADAQVDFSPYSIVYVMPPRNATGIEFSPELNFYQEPLRPDGKVIRNGVTYGNDIFIWGHRIINHETGHDISFPESYNGGPGDTHQWVGGWDVMGDPLGHAPDNMAWNKWKVGWLDNHDIGCVASDGTADITLSANGAPSDGGLTKKAAVVRTGPHTALIAELREPVGADATETITPGPHRLCDWGVLLYKLDVLKLNSYGSIQVIDQMPGSTQAGCGRDLDIATLGKGQGDGPSRYEDADTGTVFEVRAIDDAAGSATLRVTRAATRIEAAPASGVGPLTTTLTAKQLAAPAGATYSWSFGATGASVEHTFPVGRHAVTLTVRDGDAVIGTATKTVNVFAPATGDVALSAPANAATDADAQIAASLPGQDVTIEVYRRVAGTAYPLVASGTDSLKYRSPIAATDVVVACAAAGQSCVTSGRTLAADGSNLRAVPVAQRTIEWRSAGEWQELWDGETLAGWEYAGTGASNRNFMASLAGSGGVGGQRGRALLRRPPVQGLRAVRGLPGVGDELQRRRAAALPAAGDDGRRRPQRLPGRRARQRHRRDPLGRAAPGAPGGLLRAVERGGGQADARVEHAHDPRDPLARHRAPQRRARQRVPRRAARRGSHRAGERRHRRDVPARAGPRVRGRRGNRRRHGAGDALADAWARRRPSAPSRPASRGPTRPRRPRR